MNTNLSTEAQRFDQIEKLRNEIRPTKSYQVTHAPQGKTFFDEANGGSITINGHPIGVKYFYPATPHDMKQTENYARELENNLRAEHAIKHAPKQPETTTDANGYYFGDNLTPEQETHNLRMDEQLHEAVKQLNERENTSNETN